MKRMNDDNKKMTKRMTHTHYLGYLFENRHGHKASHLQTLDSSKLSHVSEYDPVRFGLVVCQLYIQVAHSGLSILPKPDLHILYMVQ